MTQKEFDNYKFSANTFVELKVLAENILYKVISVNFTDNTIQVIDRGEYKYIPIEDIISISKI